jgi:hypothetical protein
MSKPTWKNRLKFYTSRTSRASSDVSSTQVVNKEAAVLAKIAEMKGTAASFSVMGIVGAGAVGGLAAVGIASPAGPVIVGAAMAVGFCMQLYARNKELQIALKSVYNDLRRIDILYNKLLEVTKRNGITLDTSDFNMWIEKILKYIMLLIPPNRLKNLIRGEQVSAESTIMSRLGSYFSPGDYIQILLNDFTRLMGSFTILYLETSLHEKWDSQQGGQQNDTVQPFTMTSDVEALLMNIDSKVTDVLASSAVQGAVADAKAVAAEATEDLIRGSQNPKGVAQAAVSGNLLTEEEARAALGLTTGGRRRARTHRVKKRF